MNKTSQNKVEYLLQSTGAKYNSFRKYIRVNKIE